MPYLAGHGNSTTKKDARANAARDFGFYLVHKGLLSASDFSQLSVFTNIFNYLFFGIGFTNKILKNKSRNKEKKFHQQICTLIKVLYTFLIYKSIKESCSMQNISKKYFYKLSCFYLVSISDSSRKS
jgi:hypothetical protein